MKMIKPTAAAAGALSLCMVLHAAGTKGMAAETALSKQDIKRADSPVGMLAEGEFRGRLRINTFRWNWREESPAKRDNWAAAVGGSLLYDSAEFRGLNSMAGLYTSQNPWHMESGDVGFLKAGKDTTDRYSVKKTGDWGVTVLAQAYLQYRFSETKVRFGRQIFESLLTSANDTKMIPNTFYGLSLISNDLYETTVKAALFSRQKLRGHTRFHDVLTYRNAEGDSWANNDDSAVNRSLTYQQFVSAGLDPNHDLVVLEASASPTASLKLKTNYTAVPGVVSSATLEAHYTVRVDGYKIVPGVRYMKQYDGLDGRLGAVANLKGDTTGYAAPESLDGRLFAARIDIEGDSAWRLRLGYSKVADGADIVAPWRGFPTGGFTRAMGQYNWYADTETYMVRGDYSFDEAGLVPGLSVMFRYAIQNFDDTKPGVQADTTVLHLDATERFRSFPGLETRLRIAFADGDAQSAPIPKENPSYSEYRFELNYFF